MSERVDACQLRAEDCERAQERRFLGSFRDSPKRVRPPTEAAYLFSTPNLCVRLSLPLREDRSQHEELTVTRRLREDETRWRFGLPGVCEHW